MAVHEGLRPTRAALEGAVPSPLWRPWRFAAGFALGAACATKWSGGLALAGAALLALAWEINRRRAAGFPTGRAVWKTIQMELLGGILAFVIVPIAVYVMSYTRYFVFQSWHPGTWWEMQRAAFHFHHSELHYIDSAGKHAHPYESKPWTWLAMLRPVSYYYTSPGGPRTSAEVLAMGHPVLFWGSILTIPAMGWQWVRQRDWRPAFILVAVLVQYLPWFLAAGEVQFLFYMTPITPFLVLGTVYVLRDLADARAPATVRGPYLSVVWAYVATYLAVFAFFYPVLVGWHLSYTAWHWRMWMPSWI
jgi:dolichyl-phosphate-mannose-protein mannosyltransferase